MPTYDYSCENGHVNTETRSITEDTKLTACQEEGCESTVLNRIYTPISATYKGSGFYSTDNRIQLMKPGQVVDW